MQAEIKFNISCPENCSEQEFKQWLENEIGVRDDIDTTNPLYGESIYMHYLNENPAEITITT